MISPKLNRPLRTLTQASYDAGVEAHGRGVPAEHRHTVFDRNVRAWWYRGWLDAQIASEDTKHEQIRDQYPRTRFGAQPQGDGS